MIARLTICIALAFAAIGHAAAETAPAPSSVARAVTIAAFPIEAFDTREPAKRRFGALQFRGGLVLTSSDKDFGGLSGLDVGADGSLLAVTDKGQWLSARIVYRGTAPVGIADAVMAPVLGPDGRPLARRGWYDMESLVRSGPYYYVGIERTNRIVRFRAPAGPRAALVSRGRPLDVPAIRDLRYNKGLEALAVAPKGGPLAGALIGLSEASFDADGNIRAFLIGGPSPGSFSVRRSADYDISDAAMLPPGDLLILERKFSWAAGVAIRIRRVPLASIRPGTVVDGPVLMEADFTYQIDNMEGMAIHREGSDVVLTLVSDNNFSAIQRTLLLQFTLVAE